VTGVNCGLPTAGAVGRRGAGRPRAQARAADHPAGPRAFIDVVTDIDPPFVINNESGWYEGRMIHDATVPAVGPPRSDGHASASDHFPDTQTNVVPIHLSMGAYKAKRRPRLLGVQLPRTNWPHPLYELPFTGGFSDNFGNAADTFSDGEIGALKSIVPGSGPNGVPNAPQAAGDGPNLPRDPRQV
jgi:hypothetical protein